MRLRREGCLPFGKTGRSEVAQGLSASPRTGRDVAADSRAHRGRVSDLVGTPIIAGQVASRLGLDHHAIGLAEYRDRLLGTEGLLSFQTPKLTSIASAFRHDFLAATGRDLENILKRPAQNGLDRPVEVVTRD